MSATVYSGTPILVSTSATNYYQIGNNQVATFTSDADAQEIFESAGVFSNLYLRVYANGLSSTTTIITRKATTTDGNLTISITSGSTGEFEDTTHTDTVTAADKWNYKLTTGAGGTTLSGSNLAMLFTPTTNTVQRLASGGSLTLSTASTTTYNQMSARTNGNATEANVQHKFNTAGTLKNGFLYVKTNGRASSGTSVITRKGGVNGNVTISVSASATGAFEDTSNTDTVSVADLWNWAFTTGTGTGNFIYHCIACDFVTTDSTSMYFLGTSGTGSVVNASTVAYNPVQSVAQADATEANENLKSNIAVTFSKITTYISANTVVAASTVDFRKNSGAGNQSASVTGLTTGEFTDGSNSDAVVATDQINTRISTGVGGTSLTMRYVGIKLAYPAAETTAKKLAALGAG